MVFKLGPFILREEHRLGVLRRIFGPKEEAMQTTRELQNDEPNDYISAYIRTYKHIYTYICVYVCMYIYAYSP
jgi:hypothetical protein